MSNPILSEFHSLQLEAVNEKTSSDRLYELAQISIELAQLVAKNYITPPELLGELADSSDATTRQNVAANPNTPTEVLLNLVNDFPREVLNNPVFPLLVLENLNIVDRISQLDTLWKIVQDAYTSTEVLRMLVHHKNTQLVEAVKLHVNLAGEMQQEWDEAAREAIRATDWREAIASNDVKNSNRSFLNRNGFIPDFAIAQLVRHKHGSIRRLIADKLSTPVQLLEQLARDKDSLVRESVARNPNTPVELLEELAKDWNRDVRGNVAQNPNIPIKLLEQLAKDNDYSVCNLVARHPNAPVKYLDAPVKYLEELAQDKDYSVRRLIAKNPNAPVKLLEQLAQDRYSSVRDYVAANPNTPVKLLEQLAQDKDKFIRGTVAKNPNSPLRLLEQLAQDDKIYVRQYVAANPNTSVQLLEQLAQDRNEDVPVTEYVLQEAVRKNVAANPNTPIKLLEQLAQYKNEYIRKSIAHNPNTPVQLLELLAQDENDRVRLYVAQNPNTPVQLLELLAQDENKWVREAIASNPNTPLVLLDQLLKQLAQDVNQYLREFVARHPKTPVSLFLEVTLKFCPQDSTPSLMRFLVLLHPQAPYPALDKYYCSEVWLERYAVAQNSNSSPHILKVLVKDANRIVRAAAKANLQNRQSKL